MTISQSSQKILDNFKLGTAIQPEISKRLNDLIIATPALQAQLNHASQNKKWLETIALAQPGELENASASYLDGTLTLNKDDLLSTKHKTDSKLVFTLGHELKHAQNRADDMISEKDFAKRIEEIAKQPGVRDYSAALEERLKFRRYDEASAQISGWNAALSFERQKNPNITPLELADKLGLNEKNMEGSSAEFFFDKETRKPLPGIKFEADGSIALNPQNIEAMSKHYYDQSADKMRVGLAESDYRNRDASVLISSIIQQDNKYQANHAPDSYAQIDMKQLKLEQAQIQSNDLRLFDGLGKSGVLHHYAIVDSSDKQNPSTMHFYRGSEVPPNKPKVTPGLPNANNQPDKQSANDSSVNQTANQTVNGAVDHLAMWQRSIEYGCNDVANNTQTTGKSTMI